MAVVEEDATAEPAWLLLLALLLLEVEALERRRWPIFGLLGVGVTRGVDGANRTKCGFSAVPGPSSADALERCGMKLFERERGGEGPPKPTGEARGACNKD